MLIFMLTLLLPTLLNIAAPALYIPKNGYESAVIIKYSTAQSITDSSTVPNISLSSGLVNETENAVIITENINKTVSSCAPDFLDSSSLPLPIYWLQTTAPPVASAAITCMISLLILSTRATPATAASPDCDTISVSTSPTSTASNCSNISGIISFLKSLPLNNICNSIIL